MDNNRKPEKLGELGRYLPEAFRFYNLKTEYLTPVVFSLIFLVSFLGNLIPGMNAGFTVRNISIITFTLIIVQIAYTVYLSALLNELKGENISAGDIIKSVLKLSPRIIITSVLCAVIIAIGIVFLIVPGIIASIVLLFNTCVILDLDKGIWGAILTSKKITDGNKRDIFVIFLVFIIAAFLPVLLITMFATLSGNSLVYSFVVSFISSIISLMQQKLVALMYMDLKPVSEKTQ
jgi:hypothetical protein